MTNGNVDEITRLVNLFQQGDNQAFTRLVRLFRRRIYALAYKMLLNHAEADEVVQETFVRLYKNISQLQSPKYFSSFVYRIASNYGIDLLRKRKGLMVGMPDEKDLPGSLQLTLSRQVSDPVKNLENKELLRAILKAAEELPPRQRMTLLLHDVEGLSKDEVARIMECPEATVRSNLHIARGKLKRRLKEFLK